jgi:hypothetical protein
MMNDTSDEARKKQLEIIFSKSREERLLMGLQMMEDARQMVMNGIRKQTPGISEADLKITFINRYYKNDLSEKYLMDVAQWIRTKYPV